MISDEQNRRDRPQPRATSEDVGRPSLPGKGDRHGNQLAPARKPRSIELRIEELVLNGFDSSSRYQIAETIERELARLFNEDASSLEFHEDVEVRHLDCGTLEMKRGAGAEANARQLARAIYRGLNR